VTYTPAPVDLILKEGREGREERKEGKEGREGTTEGRKDGRR
jgi:hypothetical protein